MTEKVTLVFKDKTIKSLKDLRENFDKETCLQAFKDGTLERWLRQHYYEQEADEIQWIQPEDSNCFRKLCKILELNFIQCMELSKEELAAIEAKREKISQYTSDEKILASIHLVAMNQEELAALLDADENEIYLCNESFSIPICKSGISYTGFGNVTVEHPFTKEQYQKAGITVNNITLPENINPDTEGIARHAAKENGYDDFGETHCSLATAFHQKTKSWPLISHYSLPTNFSLATTFFTSKSECEAAKRNELSTAYRKATDYITPGNPKCFANEAAKYYSKKLTSQCTLAIEPLAALCKKQSKMPAFEKIQDMVCNCEKHLLHLFEQELREKSDYYEMYQFNYFMDKVEVEEQDYRISEDPFGKLFERVFTDNIQYTITDISSAVLEIETDLNKHANTFFKTAQRIYEKYIQEIEMLLEDIGKNLPAMNEDESLNDYLVRQTA